MINHHYAVIGNPISHSLSPTIHQLFAQQIQRDISYEALLVSANDLVNTITQFNGHGLNVTAPFKEPSCTLMHELSPTAKKIQAVNTIIFKPDGTRYGENTDAHGFITDIKINHGITLINKHILVLGAGGAARGVLYALHQEQPAKLMLANRTETKAQQLAQEFSAIPLSLAAVNTTPYDILINTVSELPADLHFATLAPDTFCYDINYSLAMTPFIRKVIEQGATHYSDGLGMLIEQAAQAFYLWHQQKPDTAPVAAFLQGLRKPPVAVRNYPSFA